MKRHTGHYLKGTKLILISSCEFEIPIRGNCPVTKHPKDHEKFRVIGRSKGPKIVQIVYKDSNFYYYKLYHILIYKIHLRPFLFVLFLEDF